MRYLLSLSLICLMSCSAFKKVSSNITTDLKLTSWTLISIPGFQIEKTYHPATLVFLENNRIGGSTGCNSYGGLYSLKNDLISFGEILATKKACVPGMQTEIHFFEVLQKTNHYEVKDTKLILKDGDTVLATFSRLKK